jgi:hypothetical protein
MPIARSPAVLDHVLIPGAVADDVIFAGQAVALVDLGSGPVLKLCSSTLYAREFVGFAAISVAPTGTLPIIARRGSVVVPVVEGAAPLTPNDPVFLSATPGEITQTAPTTTGNTVYQVGHAFSAAEMILTTDYRVHRP